MKPANVSRHSAISLLRPSCPFEPRRPRSEMAWSASSIRDFRNCPRLFYWRKILGLRPYRPPAALAIGTLFHQALETWYKSRFSMEKIAGPILKKFEQDCFKYRELWSENEIVEFQADLEALHGMLFGYGEIYSEDRERWPKQQRHPGLWFEFKIADLRFVGQEDLIVLDEKKRASVFEHKTATRIQKSYLDRLPLDTQVRLYVLAAEQMGFRVKEVVYNVARKTNLRRKKGESLQVYLRRIADDYVARHDWYFIRETLRFNRSDVHDLIRDVHLIDAYYQSLASSKQAAFPEAWPINDFMCDAKGFCMYFGLCTIGVDAGTSRPFYQQEPKQKRKINEEESANQ